jgi:hypothetical protein
VISWSTVDVRIILLRYAPQDITDKMLIQSLEVIVVVVVAVLGEATAPTNQVDQEHKTQFTRR